MQQWTVWMLENVNSIFNLFISLQIYSKISKIKLFNPSTTKKNLLDVIAYHANGYAIMILIVVPWTYPTKINRCVSWRRNACQIKANAPALKALPPFVSIPKNSAMGTLTVSTMNIPNTVVRMQYLFIAFYLYFLGFHWILYIFYFWFFHFCETIR